MLQKATFRAHPDIALVKYWGKKDEVLRLPINGSISLVLDALETVTTVAFDPSLTSDQVMIDGELEVGEQSRVLQHLDRIRHRALERGVLSQPCYARVVSVNNFPKSTGLSSSSSGFAALTLAANRALGLELSDRELSILARQGSGSACRCIFGGVVEWLDGDTSETSYAVPLDMPKIAKIRDIVTIVSQDRKQLSSTAGHNLAPSSPFFAARQELLPQKIVLLKQALQVGDFTAIGELAEAEALEFHSILLTSKPNALLLYPGTVAVLHAVRRLREQGVVAYCSMNTGFNAHVLTLPEHEAQVIATLTTLPEVQKVIPSGLSKGPGELQQHLF